MHAKNIFHNDLKLDNILLSDDLTPVIGDLGQSGQMALNKNYLNNPLGSYLY